MERGDSFTYDTEADWYVFSGRHEPLFAGDSFWAERGDSYVTDVLDNCLCQITIARDADIAASIRYDSENGPMAKDMRMDWSWTFPDEDYGLAYQITPIIGMRDWMLTLIFSILR